MRDPKVWKEDGRYYMVQGARTKENVGQVLIFESEDKINWKFKSRIESEKPFGYMWECRIVRNTRILRSQMAGSIVLHFREKFM